VETRSGNTLHVTEESGGRVDAKGEPDSEIYRQQKDFNRRINYEFKGLREAAREDDLPDIDGFADVIRALGSGNMNDIPQDKLYRYIGELANMDIEEVGDEQARISARTVLKYTSFSAF
jgi:hypothetical protein